jgi:protein-disulfide isomerase
MPIKDKVETGATITLALCALVVTGALVRREFFPPPPENGPKPPALIEEWQRFANSDQSLGSQSAVSKIVVFSDFQCPFCKQLAGSIRTLLAKHGKDILVYHRNFPLESIHPEAKPAAVAAICATRQGRFHEYHDYLFDHQATLASLDWTTAAIEVGVQDSTLFRECLSDSTVSLTLTNDSIAAAELHIKGTPLVMVNGWLFDGTPSAAQIEEVLAIKKGN